MEERCRFGYFDGWPSLSFIVPPISHLVLRSLFLFSCSSFPLFEEKLLEMYAIKMTTIKSEMPVCLNSQCKEMMVYVLWLSLFCLFWHMAFSVFFHSNTDAYFFCRKMQIKRKNVILGTQFLEFHYGCYQLYILRPTIQSLITHTYFIK